jgi:hypothetical protein
MNSGGIITAPVSVSDCQQVLKMTYSDVGRICGNEHGKTNKWAKWKPVRLAKLFCQDYDNTKGDYDSIWWKGSDRKCGLDINTVNTFQALINAYNNGVWKYIPPNGGTNAPYRLGDFIGYSHAAKCFIESVSGVVEIYEQDNDNLIMDANWNNTLDSYSLKTSDFDLAIGFNITESYFGFLIANSSGPVFGISNTGFIDPTYWERVTMSANGIIEGNYTLYPFLSNLPIPVRSSSMQGGVHRLIPLPVDPFNVSVLGYYFHLILYDADITLLAGRLSFTVYVRYTNSKNAQIHVNPIYLAIYRNDMYVTSGGQILPSTTVNANSFKDDSASLTLMMEYAPGDKFRLEISCDVPMSFSFIEKII